MKTQLIRQPLFAAIAGVAALLCTFGGTAAAKKVTVDVALDKPLLLAGHTQTAHLRLGLRGFALDSPSGRSPVNVALVLDKSGSMQGSKIAAAKEAVIMALRRLDQRDIVSVVTYDSTVEVIVPATRLSEREAIEDRVRRIRANGSTALFGGVSKGAAELRKFLDAEHVNRIVLLSDGIANVGPSSPEDLGALGVSLAKEGITVTTIGLGLDFNEDLMTQLAMKSDGHHYFAERLEDLEWAFDQEFGNAVSIVAQGIIIEIHCAPGIRPLRFIGKEAEIDGQTAILSLNNLLSEGERRAVLEVEITPPAALGESFDVATVDVAYENMATHSEDRLRESLAAGVTDSEQTVDRNLDEKVMVDVVKLQAAEQNILATALRDQGRIEEAYELLLSNSAFLTSNAQRLNSKELEDYAEEQRIDAQNLDEEDWKRQRKEMRESQTKALH